METTKSIRLTTKGAGYAALAILLLVLLSGNIPAQAASIVINEFLADPPSGFEGDANGDGTRH